METYMTLKEVARQLGTRSDRLTEFCRREEDPMPVRYMPGRKSGGFVIVAELNEWMERNTVHWSKRGDKDAEDEKTGAPKPPSNAHPSQRG